MSEVMAVTDHERIPRGDALLIVDPQVDFCPGGALAVEEGDRVMAPLSDLAAEFAAAGRLVFVSRDWHPPRTRHFEKWPVHCVRGTPGAEFHPALRLPEAVTVITKGTREKDDGYSAFEGLSPGGLTFEDELRRHGVTRLHVGGLATDYCVLHSVLDARVREFEVVVHADAVRAVNAKPGDGERALREMEQAGATLASDAPARR
jgi:nicotinamidase/pyrazinamidase